MIKFLSKTNPRFLGGTALLRLDFNSEDDWRIKSSVPTIKILLRYASRVVIISHKGRPHGFDKKLSLRKNALQLQRLLGKKTVFVPRHRFDEIGNQIKMAPGRTVFVLENMRFLPGEEKNDSGLAKKLARLADYYINDAFPVCHRADSSISAITKFLPSYAGLELEKEIKFLSEVTKKPRHPLILIIGGSKASDKLGVVEYFKNKADSILLGGASANTILSLRGVDIKSSLMDREKSNLKKLNTILKYKNLVLPVDFKWHKDAILDIGEKSTKEFVATIKNAKTVIWSGPIGLFEKKPFDKGTLAVALAIVHNRSAFSLTGGGETVEFIRKHRLNKGFGFISTGGSAMLDYLAGKKLPGIEALK